MKSKKSHKICRLFMNFCRVENISIKLNSILMYGISVQFLETVKFLTITTLQTFWPRKGEIRYYSLWRMRFANKVIMPSWTFRPPQSFTRFWDAKRQAPPLAD